MAATQLEDVTPSAPPPLPAIVTLGVLAMVLALRAAHFSSALLSPLSYQPGPDEEYYLRFGMAVAAGSGQFAPEFTFMDPAYGYLLGAVFKLLGPNVPAVYVLQALLDTVTAYGVLVAARLLGRPRAGVIGALLYGVTSTAIMFCTTLLKETCVAAFLTWAVVIALRVRVPRAARLRDWVLLGLYVGCGVALRSNLMVLALAAVALPYLAARDTALPHSTPPARSTRAKAAAAVAFGVVLALLPWAARNQYATGSASPLPHNSGIVLHQLYNDANPASSIWIPPFVNYSSPEEIWRGYAAEASRRAGRVMSPFEVDRYWRDEAMAFIGAHPGFVAGVVLRKAAAFVSSTEIPNNRSAQEERLFSPLLRLLPAPAPWLLGFGFAGLLWLAREDRRWPILAAPIALAWFSVAVFWAEDRFRFHAYGVLALCAGLCIDRLLMYRNHLHKLPALGFAASVCVVAALSLYLGWRAPPPPVRWDHVVWGYIKMHNANAARALAINIVAAQPDNAPVVEALGYLDSVQEQFPDAERELEHAIALRPRSHAAHYNLARVYRALGKHDEALAEARTAVALHPAPDYAALLRQIEAES